MPLPQFSVQRVFKRAEPIFKSKQKTPLWHFKCSRGAFFLGLYQASSLFFLIITPAVAAAVITVAGVPFRVLVRQHAAHGRHDGGGNDVLAGDQLNVLALTAQLAVHGLAQFGVSLLYIANGIDHVLIHTLYLLFFGRSLAGGAALSLSIMNRPYSVPLVESTPSIRASLRVAASSALANALNIASSLWWSFSPYSTFKCRFIMAA